MPNNRPLSVPCTAVAHFMGSHFAFYLYPGAYAPGFMRQPASQAEVTSFCKAETDYIAAGGAHQANPMKKALPGVARQRLSLLRFRRSHNRVMTSKN